MSYERSKVIVQGGGIGFWGLLLVVFIALKVTGSADMSWFWAFSPLWIPLSLLGGTVLVIFLMVVVLQGFRWLGRKRMFSPSRASQ